MFHTSSWMKDLKSYLSHKPFTAILIPGTHDSCTYSITEHSDICPTAPPALSKLSKVPGISNIVGSIMCSWARCQGLSILEQLQYGVRYLDIRLIARNDEIWTAHGMYSISFREAITDVVTFIQNSPDEFVFIDINHADLMEPKHDEMVKKILKETGCFEKMVRRDQNPTSLQTPLGQLWGKAGFAGRLYVSYCRTFSGVEAGALWPCAQSPWPNVTAVDNLIEKLDQSLSARPAVPTNVFVSQGVLTPNDNMIKDSLNPVKLGTMNSIGDMAKVANSAAVSWFYSPTTPNNRNVLIVDFVDMMNTTETVIRMNIPTTIVYANYGGIDVTEQTRKISTIVGALRWGRGSYASTLAIVPLGDENTNPFVVVTQQHTTKEMEVHLYSDSDPIHLLWGTDQKRVPSKPIPKGTQYGNKVIAANYGGLDVNAKVQQLWTASGVSYRGEDIPKLMGILPSGPPKPLVIIFQQMTSSTTRVGVSVLYDFPGEVATIAVRSVGAAGKTKSSVLPESAIIAIKEPELRALFAKFDTDNSGFLFRDEFRKEYLAMEAAVGVNLTTKQADALFSKYDANGDGKLFFDEFALLMLSRTKM